MVSGRHKLDAGGWGPTANHEWEGF